METAGEEVVVEGVVASVHATPKGVAFINLGEGVAASGFHRVYFKLERGR
jgi:hypothetical protein